MKDKHRTKNKSLYTNKFQMEFIKIKHSKYTNPDNKLIT